MHDESHHEAAVCIQRHWKGFTQRRLFGKLMIQMIEAAEEAREVEEKRRVERWMLRKETELLEK